MTSASAEIEKLFEPVLEKTKQLVSRQLAAAWEAGMPAIKARRSPFLVRLTYLHRQFC